MLKGRSSLPGRRWALLVVVALLGLSVGSVTATAGASSWHEAGATTAKKKCKKKKRSASSAKKKKCKKKKKHPVTPVTPPAPKSPVVRAQISWSTGAEIDLHAWSSGLHDGWDESLGAFDIEIPGTTYEYTSSSERIIDSNPSNIPLTFAICDYDDAGSTDVTVQVIYQDGTVDNEFFEDLTTGDYLIDPREEGGPADPVADWCP
jgi:hypothetical protein